MVKTGAYGITDEQAQELVERLAKLSCYIMEEQPGEGATKAPEPPPGAESKLLSRPVRVMVRKPHAGHEGKTPLPLEARDPTDKPYEHGALAQVIKNAASETFMEEPKGPQDQPMQVRIRAGRVAVGHLPAVPEVNDRIKEREFRKGDVQRVLEEKTASDDGGTTGVVTGTAAGSYPLQMGPVGSALDYGGRAALGAGIGRTLGFLAKGKIPEALERRIGIGGAAAGLALAAASHREQKRRMAAAEALRELAEAKRKEFGGAGPLNTAEQQIHALLESGAKAEGLEPK